MVFSSPFFLYAFLPVLLLVYFLAPKKIRNWVLLLFSLYFYYFGEQGYLLILLASIVMNFSFASLMTRHGQHAGIYLATGVTLNLALLFYYKYAGFVTGSLGSAFSALMDSPEPPFTGLSVHLPIGISFFTFQAVSLLVDIHRDKVRFDGNLSRMALFITLFPQLIAGPIVRYADVVHQIQRRKERLSDIAKGLQRFVLGLGKKVILANSFGEVCDSIFAQDPGSLPTGVAWIGVLAYTFQIYFDFSGYSDMAIGLCRIFGLSIKENFRYPYASRSLTEFWRRWHISLSTWFRDYLYIPLGGSRHGPIRTYRNLLIVFVLCGLWHGASWNFLLWGLFHGLFLVFERLLVRKRQWKIPPGLAHLYCLWVVMMSWVFFRAENLHFAVMYFKSMYTFNNPEHGHGQRVEVLSADNLFLTVIAIVAAAGFTPFLRNRLGKALKGRSRKVRTAGLVAINGMLGVYVLFVLALCSLRIYAGYYDPFIYFRF